MDGKLISEHNLTMPIKNFFKIPIDRLKRKHFCEGPTARKFLLISTLFGVLMHRQKHSQKLSHRM